MVGAGIQVSKHPMDADCRKEMIEVATNEIVPYELELQKLKTLHVSLNFCTINQGVTLDEQGVLHAKHDH